jgi:hypothetical protein
VQAVLVPVAARVAQELSAAALVAVVAVVQEQAAPELVAPAELLAVPVVQEQAAPEQVAAEELAVPAAPARAAAVVHRMAVWGCSTESP